MQEVIKEAQEKGWAVEPQDDNSLYLQADEVKVAIGIDDDGDWAVIISAPHMRIVGFWGNGTFVGKFRATDGEFSITGHIEGPCGGVVEAVSEFIPKVMVEVFKNAPRDEQESIQA